MDGRVINEGETDFRLGDSFTLKHRTGSVAHQGTINRDSFLRTGDGNAHLAILESPTRSAYRTSATHLSHYGRTRQEEHTLVWRGPRDQASTPHGSAFVEVALPAIQAILTRNVCLAKYHPANSGTTVQFPEPSSLGRRFGVPPVLLEFSSGGKGFPR